MREQQGPSNQQATPAASAGESFRAQLKRGGWSTVGDVERASEAFKPGSAKKVKPSTAPEGFTSTSANPEMVKFVSKQKMLAMRRLVAKAAEEERLPLCRNPQPQD